MKAAAKGQVITKKYPKEKNRGLIGSLILFIIVGIGIYGVLKSLLPSQIPIAQIPPHSLSLYFQGEEKYKVPWYIFAAIDLEDKKSPEAVTEKHIGSLAVLLSPGSREQDMEEILSGYQKDSQIANGAVYYARKLQTIDKVLQNKTFPIDPDNEYQYSDDWGNERTYGGKRKHEGTDIMCRKGIPIHSVGDGAIEKKGWNELGGWRIGIRGDDGMYYYYAHMSKYAPNLHIGDRINRGEIIGYVGDSGYGKEGTTGKFAPHLHFGIYEMDKAISPVPFLKIWEKNSSKA